MKGCFVLIFACLFASVFAQNDPWVLVWADEFNETKLNTYNWQIEVNCWGGGNNEMQCYTSRQDNVRVENGNLVLAAVYEPNGYMGSTDDCTLNTQNSCFWTRNFRSGRVRSRAKNINSWKYGRFEMRAQLPNGKHLWPAFWMMPSDDIYGTWAASGEIDIMEYRGQNVMMNEGTLHFGAPWPDNVHQGSGPLNMNVGDMSAGYHIFAVEWEQDQMKWYVDNNNFHTMNLNVNFSRGPFAYAQNRSPFDQRFHILLNLAVGGGFFPPEIYGNFAPEESRQWANPTYKIDYVRVYQRKSSIPIPEECTSGITISMGSTDTVFSSTFDSKESSSVPQLTSKDVDDTEVKESSSVSIFIGFVCVIALLFQ